MNQHGSKSGRTVCIGMIGTVAIVMFTVSCTQSMNGPTGEWPTASEARVGTVYRLGLGRGELLLESIEKFIADHDIHDGAVLTGIGSLSECRIHWPEAPVYPPNDVFVTYKGALEITGMQGIIADGQPHIHMMVAEGGDGRAIGGHLEHGSKVLYLAEITIAKFNGPPMTRRPNEHGVNMLQPK